MHTMQTLSQLDSAEDFSYAFRNFLDAMYAEPTRTPLEQPPCGPDRTRNAYLAATCDYLCNKFHWRKPEWLYPPGVTADTDPFVADPPYFASNYWKTRIWLLTQSPQEFRSRNIFIGFDALSRT